MKQKYLFRFQLILSFSFFMTMSQAQKKDTLFLKISNNIPEQIVFIDTAHSIFHREIINILLNNDRHKESSTIISNPLLPNQKSIFDNWISVEVYKNKYCAYYPSETFHNTYISVDQDSIRYNDFNEGFVTYKISKIKSKKNVAKVFFINENNIENIFLFRRVGNEVIKFKPTSQNKKSIYLASVKKYISMPIIVNYCPTSRCQEFNFKN
jgi:hypothetical protein